MNTHFCSFGKQALSERPQVRLGATSIASAAWMASPSGGCSLDVPLLRETVTISAPIWNTNAYGITAHNNIIVTESSTAVVFTNGGTTSGNSFDYNLYFPSAGFYYGGNKYASLNAVQSGIGFEQNGLSADPQFANAASDNYRLSSSSPCIDTGVDVSSSGVVEDIEGKPRPQGKGFDRGAYEVGSPAADGSAPVSPDASPGPVVKADAEPIERDAGPGPDGYSHTFDDSFIGEAEARRPVEGCGCSVAAAAQTGSLPLVVVGFVFAVLFLWGRRW